MLLDSWFYCLSISTRAFFSLWFTLNALLRDFPTWKGKIIREKISRFFKPKKVKSQKDFSHLAEIDTIFVYCEKNNLILSKVPILSNFLVKFIC